MINFSILILLYVAILVGAVIHEFGHFGKMKISWIPFNSYTINPKFFGFYSLIPEIAIFIGISYFKPEIVFLNYLALVLYLHIIYSTIFGYFGISLGSHNITPDNYKNKLALIVGIGLSIYYFNIYYPFAIQTLRSLLGT